MLEFAIVVPVLLVVVIAFVDLLVPIVRETWHWSAATQLVNKSKRAPMVASIVNIPVIGPGGGTVPEIQIRTLTQSELTTTVGSNPGFLTQVNRLMIQALEEAGSGSNLLDHDVASRLVYFDVCPAPDSVVPYPSECVSNNTPMGRLAGHAYRKTGQANPIVAGGVTFHQTDGGGSSCIGNVAAADAELSNYINQRAAIIYRAFDQRPNIPTLPTFAAMTIGPTAAPPSGIFNKWVPVIAVYVCSKGGQIIDKAGTSRTMFLLFPGQEVSF